MATIHRLKDLEVEQKALEFCNLIYPFTLKGSFAFDFTPGDRINSSSSSTMNNIVERFGQEFKRRKCITELKSEPCNL